MNNDEYSIYYYANEIRLGHLTINDVPVWYKTDVRIILKGWGIDV